MPHFRKLRSLTLGVIALLIHRNWLETSSKAIRLYRRAGFRGFISALSRISGYELVYANWVQKYGTLTASDISLIREHMASFSYRPKISVLMPVYNTPERYLRLAIESVKKQAYQNWELCIADDASTEPHVRAILEEFARLDSRIHVTMRSSNGHISAASNSALSLCSGEFVALLDHDDELPQHALYLVAMVLEKSPDINLIYSDEDKIDERGRRFGPYFKPDWNPDLMTSQNMVSHLGIYRTELIRSIGGFREGVEGSQDWDLALRASEHIPASSICHIPHILYHWRAIPGSAAVKHEEKSYIVQASLRVVQDHLERIGHPGTAVATFSSFVRVHYPLPDPAPLVSVFIQGSHKQAMALAAHTHYPALEILCREPFPPHKDILLRHVEGGSSVAEWFNCAARTANGQIFCLLDSDCLPRDTTWLEELSAHAWRDGIGAVGPLLLDNKGNMSGVQTVLCDDSHHEMVAWSYYRGYSAKETGHGGRSALLQNTTILSPGCMVLRATTFNEVGGLDAHSFPDTLFGLDLCLRLVQAGYRNLWTPYASLTVTADSPANISDASHLQEAQLFRERWKSFIDNDPAHNPNLACGADWPLPAFPPRVTKPWQQSSPDRQYQKMTKPM